jgi:hypothetical protein
VAIPEFQNKLFADVFALVEWDWHRRNINLKSEGTEFFNVQTYYFPIFATSVLTHFLKNRNFRGKHSTTRSSSYKKCCLLVRDSDIQTPTLRPQVLFHPE